MFFFRLDFRMTLCSLVDARTFNIHTPEVIPEDGGNRFLRSVNTCLKTVQHLESDLASFGVSSAMSLKFPFIWDTTLCGWVTAYQRFGGKVFSHLEWRIASIILIGTAVWSSLIPTHTVFLSLRDYLY
jgi:hypothetical protein